MESGSDEQLQRQIGNYTFQGDSIGGALPRVYMAMEQQGHANAKAISESASQHPATILRDLRLPVPDASEFLSCLSSPNLGHRLTSVSEPDYAGTRQYTRVDLSNNDGHRILIYIPDHIIAVPTDENLSAVLALGLAFDAKSFLIVFYTTFPHIRIQQIIEKKWRYDKIKHMFLQQANQIISNSPEDQKLLINAILDVSR